MSHGATRNERQPIRIAGAGRLDARQDRCASPSTASAISGLEGDTLASALLANGVHLVGRSFKYHRPRGILSAGAEEPNALVDDRARRGAQDAEPARHRCRSSTTGSPPQSQNRWPSLAFDVGAVNDLLSPFFVGGLLLQDLHVAEGGLEARSTSRSSARPPASASRRTSPIPTTMPARFAHCDVLVVGGGAAGLAAALAAAETGARVILCDEQAGVRRRACASRAARRSTARTAATGRRRRIAKLARDGQRPAAAAHDRLRLLRAEFRRPGRARHRPSRQPGQRPAARAAVAGAGQAGHPRDRRDRAATGVRRQRPAGHHAGRGGAHLSQPLRRRGRQTSRRLHRQRQRLCGGARPEEGRRCDRRHRRPPRQSDRTAWCDEARALGIEVNHGRAVVEGARQAARLLHRRRSRRAAAPNARIAGRCADDLGGLDAVGASVLAVARQGGVRRGNAAGSCPEPMRRTACRSAPATAPTALRRRSTKPIRPARTRRKAAGGTAAKRAQAEGRLRRGLDRRHARRGSRAQGRARPSRPSSISRTTSPPRTSAWRCAKACARSSTSSASPPTAWRPTRARRPTCTALPSPPRRSARRSRRSA